MLKTLNELIKLMGSHRKQLVFSLVLSFIDSILLVVPIIIAFLMIGSMPELSPETQTPLTSALVIKYMAIMIACIVARIILRYITLHQRSSVAYEVMCEERKKLGRELRKVSMGYFNQRTLGDLVATISSDAGFIELEGMGVVEKMAVGIPAIFIGIGILFVFSFKIAIVAMLLLIPAYLAYKYLAKTQDRLNLNRQDAVGEFTENTVEFIKGLPVLKTYNMTDQQLYKTQESFEKVRKLSLKIEFGHFTPTILFQLCFRLITTAIILMAGIFAISGDITFQSAFVLMLGALSLFGGVEIMGIYSIFSKMTQHSIDRINKIKDIPKMDNTSGIARLDKFDITLDNVSFAYETKTVLSSVSFTVLEKTTTALVGLSGSGKTTITNLIARFWDVSQGEIRIGGTNIKDIAYETLLKNLSFVFQDVFLFDDTVYNNIRIGRPEATKEEVKEAARKAGCHDFVQQMDNGYDTFVGEGGAKLSGGERQRISIARALLKDAPIVLLDEVTANVDVENEQQIQGALQELLKDRTVIMIAHKLSTIQNVDQILVIENGSVIQKGKHTELVKQDGLYKRLWNIQYETSRWKL